MAQNRPAPETLQPKDIEAERRRCSFSVDAMSCVFAGGRKPRDHARWLLSLLKEDEERTFEKDQRVFQSRTERFFSGHKIALRYFEIRNREGLAKEDRDLLRLYVDEYLPIQVHESMFVPTMQNQSSPEQWAQWGSSVESGRWIGCYMQSEMAHASNLSGLRTTATLDQSTDEWVIHSPEMSAGKTWIGVSGRTATHGIVLANLIAKDPSTGKEVARGMHPFLVALRSLDTHEVLPGIKITEMGPKVGAMAMDNGFILFDNVRVPRTNLLSRFQTVEKDGSYNVRNQQGRVLMRGTMTLVRVGLVEIAAHHLSRATTIAIRYAAVRRQGSSKTAGDALEPQILDYASVQQRLFTALASAYALTFVGRHLRGMFNQMMAELRETGKSDLLGIVHGYSSVLKAVATNESLQAIERARRSMGGHGYSLASGIYDFERNQPNAGLTYEGDNNMLLTGPAANFLVKQLKEIRKTGRAPVPTLSYLAEYVSREGRAATQHESRFSSTSPGDFLDAKAQLIILGHRAARLTAELERLRAPSDKASNKAAQNATGLGSSWKSLAANKLAIRDHLDSGLAARCSRAHGAYLIVASFIEYVESLRDTSSPTVRQLGAKLDPALFTVLDRLRSLYALECILADLGDLTEDGYLGPAQVRAVREASAMLMAEIRPDAVGLVEAFDMDDWYLASPLGASDGRAYERFIEWMQREPLNHSGANGGVDERGVVRTYKATIGRLIRGQVTPFNTEKEAARRRESKL